MNTYLADSVARDHIDSLVANAAASRRAKLARSARRADRAPRRWSHRRTA
jgi:hypothetical protein